MTWFAYRPTIWVLLLPRLCGWLAWAWAGPLGAVLAVCLLVGSTVGCLLLVVGRQGRRKAWDCL